MKHPFLSTTFVASSILLASLATSTTNARNITNEHPIFQENNQFCVKFEHSPKPFCTQTKEQLTKEADEEMYRDIMAMKRLHQSTDFNRLIIDSFVDNRYSALEYYFLKDESQHRLSLRNAKGSN